MRPWQAVVAAGLLAVCTLVLVGQAVRGNRTVSAQLGTTPVRNAEIDDAFYRCLDVQARSLVTAHQPVAIAPTTNLGDAVTLLKAVGGWITVADRPSRATALLGLRNDVPGGATCRGTVVVATFPGPGGVPVVRVGTGAHLGGQGPPPAPPL